MPLAQLGVSTGARCTIRVWRLQTRSGGQKSGATRHVYATVPFVLSSSRCGRLYSTVAQARDGSPAAQDNTTKKDSIQSATASSSQSGTTASTTDSQSSPQQPTDAADQSAANNHATSPCPYAFDTGFALHAKRKRNPRPFPPPFMSAPSGSFSDPLSTHNPLQSEKVPEGGQESESASVLSRIQRRKPTDGQGRALLGITNGDDAVVLNKRFIAANDGVGAWATREKGNAALWARLVVHFWAAEAQNDKFGDQIAELPSEAKQEDAGCDKFRNPTPNPVAYLQSAYESTVSATASPEIHGTTTASGALLSYTSFPADELEHEHYSEDGVAIRPILYVTQLGDSQIMVVRPKEREVIYRTAEQWHWFDCPRQLGTNSPDTPTTNAVVERVENLEEGDIVLAMSDGVGDNLWEHEIMACVVDALQRWETTKTTSDREALEEGRELDDLGRELADSKDMATTDEMMYVARELVRAARTIAEDPFAESPYMEKAIDEGLSIDGGMF
jgi:hypothetical protein